MATAEIDENARAPARNGLECFGARELRPRRFGQFSFTAV
jgi:hypothetical protein